MLTAQRALTLSAASAPELPRVEALEALYRLGCRPRRGEVIMIAGRSGSQKSGFAIWWTSQMNLPTLYLSADMSAFQASVRMACAVTGLVTEDVEARLGKGGRDADEIYRALMGVNTTFAFGHITWKGLDDELRAYIELHDAYPEIIVIDNLMDCEDAASDYTAQMDAMQNINALARHTGSTIIVLHHASDKSWEAKADPWKPPSRDQVKGGLSEKPELSLSVALDPTSYDFNIAVIKQRMGPSDPTAGTYATLTAEPAATRFHKYERKIRYSAPTTFTVGNGHIGEDAK